MSRGHLLYLFWYLPCPSFLFLLWGPLLLYSLFFLYPHQQNSSHLSDSQAVDGVPLVQLWSSHVVLVPLLAFFQLNLLVLWWQLTGHWIPTKDKSTISNRVVGEILLAKSTSRIDWVSYWYQVLAWILLVWGLFHKWIKRVANAPHPFNNFIKLFIFL